MSKEITIQYLSDEGLAMLKQNFGNNLQKYKDNDKKYFIDILNEHNYLIDSTYVIEDFTQNLAFDEDNNVNDLKNIKIVYEAMKNIPLYVMMDDRFWVGINHTIMSDYIMKRRKGEAFGEDIKDERGKIFNSFFPPTKRGKKRGSYVNCVSRLWWAGHLTIDETNIENPYSLTEEVCKTGFASTIVILSSSNILSRKESMIALLRTIKQLRNDGYDVKRDDLVAGSRYLNLIAGICFIDIMTIEEIQNILNDFYKNYYVNKNSDR